MDTTGIVRAMWKALNAWPNKPARFGLDNFEKDGFCLMLQQLPGAVVLKRYINGSFIGQWPFGVCARVRADETAQRFDAVDTLNRLNDWLRDNLFPARAGMILSASSKSAIRASVPRASGDDPCKASAYLLQP